MALQPREPPEPPAAPDLPEALDPPEALAWSACLTRPKRVGGLGVRLWWKARDLMRRQCKTASSERTRRIN